MSKQELADGYFWYETLSREYRVSVILRERDPKDRRRYKNWSRDLRAHTIKGLKVNAKKEGVELPDNVEELCRESLK